MFEIRFRIPEEVSNEISGLNAKEFDNDFNDIEGQIEINFNGKKYGLCHEEFPFGQELLIFWFELLNSVVNKLKESSYAAMIIPDTDFWYYEFIKSNEFLKVNKVQFGQGSFGGFVFASPPNTVIKYAWQNVEISLSEFQDEVIKKTDNLIKEIESINHELLKTECISTFMSINKR